MYASVNCRHRILCEHHITYGDNTVWLGQDVLELVQSTDRVNSIDRTRYLHTVYQSWSTMEHLYNTTP